MAEEMTLSDTIYDAANQWFADNGGGFIVNAVSVMEIVNDEGERRHILFDSEGLPTPGALGLLRYATLYFENQANQELLPLVWDEAGEDEE